MKEFSFKILLPLWIIVSIVSCSTSQEVAKNTRVSQWDIVPGVGIGKLRLGMTYEEAMTLLGQYTKKGGVEASKRDYQKSGYDPNKTLVFFVGFDIEVEYYKRSVSEYYPYPVMAVLFKNNRLVYIKLSNYLYRQNMVYRYSINQSLRFRSSKEQMLRVMGNDFYKHGMRGYGGSYFYLDKGIRLILDSNQKVRVIDLFAPITGEAKQEFLNRLKPKNNWN